jgi:membrane-bound lytic murein transglycosylase B
MTDAPRRSPNGVRRPFWGFKVTDEAAAAVARYMEAHGLKRERRGDLTKALNAMLATHPASRTAKPDTEETP